MNQLDRISFAIQPFEVAFALVPVLNDTPLTGIIRVFESEKRYEPADAYGGIVPERCNYGPLDRYFLGDLEDDSYFGRLDHIHLLECTCGEAGCWPLAARIKVDPVTVIWNFFQQPHRPEWDYSQFGPFIFESNKYRQAIDDLRANFSM